jgi:hypothetical protein
MSSVYSALKPLYLVSRLLGLAPYRWGKKVTAIPDISTKSAFGFSTLHNYTVFLYILSWFIFDISLDATYRYPKLSSRSIIPIVIRTCTFKGACLSAFILCRRGSLEVFCSKITLVDKILLGRTASLCYRNTKLAVVTSMCIVSVSSCLIALCDINGRRTDFISIIRISDFVLGGAIGTLIMVQYFVCVCVLKSKSVN